MFTKIYLKSISYLKNQPVQLSGLDLNVLYGICFLINRRNNFKLSSAQHYAGSHSFRLYELTSLLYRHLHPATANARILKSLERLSKAKLINLFESKEHKTISLELMSETIEMIMPKGKKWFSLPFEFFEDPAKFTNLDLDSKEVQKKLHGHDFILFMCIMSFFTDHLLDQHKNEDNNPDLVTNERLIRYWKELRQQLLQNSGNVCTESVDAKILKQQKNAISHRFYRALRRLKEIGLIEFNEIKTKGKQLLAISNLVLNSVLRDLLVKLNQKRINAYKAAVQRAEFSKNSKAQASNRKSFLASPIISQFHAETPKEWYTAQRQP